MARWRARSIGALAAAIFAVACLGGQTGQPTVGSCDSAPLADDATWHGQLSAEWVAPYVGVHQADLHWLTDASKGSAVLDLVDRVSITVGSVDQQAEVTCEGFLSVPVHVVIETEASRLHDEGEAQLRFWEPMGGPTLAFSGGVTGLTATLQTVASEQPPTGVLRPRNGGAPGVEAMFPSPPESLATAGEGGTGGEGP